MARYLDKSKPSLKVFGFVTKTLPATLTSFCTIVSMIIISYVKRPVPFLLAYNYGYLYQKMLTLIPWQVCERIVALTFLLDCLMVPFITSRNHR